MKKDDETFLEIPLYMYLRRYFRSGNRAHYIYTIPEIGTRLIRHSKERGIKLIVLQNFSVDIDVLVYFRATRQFGTNFIPTSGTDKDPGFLSMHTKRGRVCVHNHIFSLELYPCIGVLGIRIGMLIAWQI